MSREGQGKVMVRSRQHKHSLNRNYNNLMGYDTIEINLVITVVVNLRQVSGQIMIQGQSHKINHWIPKQLNLAII